jgi:hypothetical protein
LPEFETIEFLWGNDSSPMPIPQPGGPAYLSLCGTLLKTCTAYMVLPAAMLPAYIISLFH